MLLVFINNKNRALNNIGFKMTTKYLKFGLRADKNLSDLTNPDEALGNVLDDISAAVNEDGLKTGFTTTDISPLQGLRNTGLADNVNDLGQAEDLLSLKGSLVEFTVASGTSITLPPVVLSFAVDITTNTITTDRPVDTGTLVTYETPGSVSAIGGLVDDGVYYARNLGGTVISLYETSAQAIEGGVVGLKVLTSISTGTHTLTGATVTVAPGTLIEVEPRTTLQDNINNARSVLGSPPWINGGDGPIARFVSSDRINQTISANTTGNSNTVVIGSLGTNLFSTAIDQNYNEMIYPVDFWNDGVFEFQAKMHPSMANTYGLVQWTGFLSEDYNQEWESTGLFMIEEDAVGDPSTENWTTLKSVFNFSQTITGLVLTNDGSKTTVDLTNASPSGEKYVCTEMIAYTGSYNASNYTTAKNANQKVESVNMANKSCVIDGVLTGTSLTFDHVGGKDMVESPVYFTPQKRGNKIKVRYTVWYPDPGNNSNYETKHFGEASDNSDKLPFTRLYSTYDRNQVFGNYTYKFFNDNKSSPLSQLSTSPIRVNATLSMPYNIPQTHSDTLVAASGSAVTMKTVTVLDTYGKIEASDWTGCSVGDWLTFLVSNNYYTYQISEISGTIAYVKDTIDAVVSVGSTFSTMIWKNLGLVGLYKLSSSGGTQGSIYPMAGDVRPTSKVYEDMLLFGINNDGTSSGNTRRRIISSTIGNPHNITVSGGNLPTAAGGTICAVYASRGLDDKSSVLACAGVYGREVASTTSSGNSVVLTTTVGVSQNDFVQFDGRAKDASGNYIGSPPIITYGTTVASVVNATTITLSAPVNGALNAASTLVFIKAANAPSPSSTNKEFCIIPLNTAPPFAGTTLGLATPSSNANLEVEGLAFGNIAVTLPTANIITSSASQAPKYFPIETSAGTTYKALIAS